jgi:RNA polymerase sigma-70 factor (family 1)
VLVYFRILYANFKERYTRLCLRLPTRMLTTKPDLHSESDLLHQLANGNVDAYEKIFKLYWKPLYQIAYSKLGSKSDAEEVIQTLFSTLWENRETLVIDNLGAYLHRAVRNRVLNVIRAKITEQKFWEYYSKFIPSVENTTEDGVIFDDLQESLELAVNHLPEKSRTIFQLSRFEGRTNNEIAKLMKLSEKSIEYHLTKSLRAIRLHMKDYISAVALFLLS